MKWGGVYFRDAKTRPYLIADHGIPSSKHVILQAFKQP
jgi:hypothetical protein